MQGLIRFFTGRSFTVNTLCLAMALWGALSLYKMSRQMIPANNAGNKSIYISANLLGANPLEVEELVTIPIEESLRNEPGVERVTSRSRKGRANITLRFKASYSDLQKSLESVRSKIQQLEYKLPRDLRDLSVTTPPSDIMTLSEVVVTHADHRNDVHREWVKAIKQEILAVDGIFDVEDNMPERRIAITLDPTAMSRYGLSLNQVQTKVLGSLRKLPIAAFERKEDVVSISMESQSDESIEGIEAIVIRNGHSGQIITLSDIAKIEYAAKESETLQLINGKPFVELEVMKYLNADTIVTNREVEKVLTKINDVLPSPLQAQTSIKVGSFLTQQLDALTNSGFIGLVLVALALAYFIGVRESLAALIGIPLAYLGTLGVMHLFGFSINLVTVIAMFIMIGILVDDAIIVTERFSQLKEKGKDSFTAATEAAQSLIIPITGTMLTTAAAFAPILWAEGELGAIFYSIPIVIIAALVISWIECFFILPNHLHHLAAHPAKRNPIVFRWIKQGYQWSIPWIIRLRYLVVFVTVGLVAGAVFLLSSHKVPFDGNLNVDFPRLRVAVELEESQDREDTRRQLKVVEDYLMQMTQEEHALFLSQRYGSVWYDRAWHQGDRFARFDLLYDVKMPDAEKTIQDKVITVNEFLTDVKDKNPNIVLLKAEINRYSQGEDTQSNLIPIGVTYPIDATSQNIEQKIMSKLGAVAGIEDVFLEDENREESWVFRPFQKQLEKYSVSGEALAAYLRAYAGESYIGATRFQGKYTEIVMSLGDSQNLRFENLSQLKILTPAQIHIPLSRLGLWEKASIPKVIEHESLSRNIPLFAKFDENAHVKTEMIKTLDSSLEDLRREFPSFDIVVNAHSEEDKTLTELIATTGFVLAMVYIILMLTMQSSIRPLLVCSAIPLGFVGVIYALYVHDLSLGVMAFIGLLGVAGVAVNDSLIMVDAITQLKKTGMDARTAIIEGAVSRVRALVLTSITTIAGVFPMAYGIGGETGFTRPLAFALGWGLLSAILLTLVVVPPLTAVIEDMASLIEKIKKLGKPRETMTTDSKAGYRADLTVGSGSQG
ncbi:MAG: efflux RND transporter permease subunit [Pseudobacteriovorax sp.]|nr:efflux RND transporter permease subunit [Pseudobacteriovorax sp.]